MTAADPLPTYPPDACPECGASFWGDEIPEAYRASYMPPYRWRRETRIYDREKDCEVACRCPDCGHQVDRPLVEVLMVMEKPGRE